MCERTLLLILFGVQKTGKNCLTAARLVSPCVNAGALRHDSIKVTTNREVNLMASQKHLDLLLSGKTLWNTWRRAYPDVQAVEPDLHVADLHGADLRGVDLHGADLTEANLRGADLREADLREADLRNADLRSANLSDANLLQARVHWTDLRGAILCRTNLRRADLSQADLRGADLGGAILDKAIFAGASLPGGNLRRTDPVKRQEAQERRPGSAVVSDDHAA